MQHPPTLERLQPPGSTSSLALNLRLPPLLLGLTSDGHAEAPHQQTCALQAKHGYSRDHRPDCRQVVLALVVTPEGLPLAYEVMPSNTQDKQTLKALMARLESLHSKADRIWIIYDPASLGDPSAFYRAQVVP